MQTVRDGVVTRISTVNSSIVRMRYVCVSVALVFSGFGFKFLREAYLASALISDHGLIALSLLCSAIGAIRFCFSAATMTLTLDSGSRVATLTGQTFTRVQTNVLEFGDIVEAVHADDGDASFVRLKLIDGRLLALNPVGIDPVSAQTAVDAINGVIRQS